MKQIQFIGSRDKSDFLIYLAHTIANTDKRVLIVDTSKARNYMFAYGETNSDDAIGTIQNVEFISGIKAKDELFIALHRMKEELTNFDYIFVDISEREIVENWLTIENNYYVSDNVRMHIMKDVDLINEYLDRAQAKTIRRIHFESTYEVAEGYMDFLLDNRATFVTITEAIELDLNHEVFKQYMQHEQEIPYKRLNKQYKSVLKEIATEICEITHEDLKATTKVGSLFTNIFNKSKAAPNNIKEVK